MGLSPRLLLLMAGVGGLLTFRNALLLLLPWQPALNTLHLLPSPSPAPAPALLQDTAAISTLRCLKLFLERMGAHHLDPLSMASMAGRSVQLVSEHGSWGGG